MRDIHMIHHLGLNIIYKNIFFNRHSDTIFTASNLARIAVLQTTYDTNQSGYGYPEFDLNTPVSELPPAVILVYTTVAHARFPVTPFSVLNGMLAGLDGILGRVISHRATQEKTFLKNGLSNIVERFDFLLNFLDANPGSNLEQLLQSARLHDAAKRLDDRDVEVDENLYVFFGQAWGRLSNELSVFPTDESVTKERLDLAFAAIRENPLTNPAVSHASVQILEKCFNSMMEFPFADFYSEKDLPAA